MGLLLLGEKLVSQQKPRAPLDRTPSGGLRAHGARRRAMFRRGLGTGLASLRHRRDTHASLNNHPLSKRRPATHGRNLPHKQIDIGKRILIVASALTDALRMFEGNRKTLHKQTCLLLRQPLMLMVISGQMLG